jgi:hypothetical protein
MIATRLRTLQVSQRHNQANGINVCNNIVDKFLFRIQAVRTDRGHEFQKEFQGPVGNQGIRHASYQTEITLAQRHRRPDVHYGWAGFNN